MSEIRDKVTEEMLQFIRHGYSPESMVKDILSIRELAVVDRNADLPEAHMHPPEGVLMRFISDMRKEGWVKEVE